MTEQNQIGGIEDNDKISNAGWWWFQEKDQEYTGTDHEKTGKVWEHPKDHKEYG